MQQSHGVVVRSGLGRRRGRVRTDNGEEEETGVEVTKETEGVGSAVRQENLRIKLRREGWGWVFQSILQWVKKGRLRNATCCSFRLLITRTLLKGSGWCIVLPSLHFPFPLGTPRFLTYCSSIPVLSITFHQSIFWAFYGHAVFELPPFDHLCHHITCYSNVLTKWCCQNSCISLN